MKRNTNAPIYVFLAFLLSFLYYIPCSSQCTGVFTIFTEDFEDNGNTANGGAGRYASPNDFHEGVAGQDDDYWGRIHGPTTNYYLTNTDSGFPTHANTPYTGWNGNFYYAGEDMDDVGGSIGNPDGLDTKEILFSGLDINGATNMCFSGLFARGENDPCDASVYDTEDYIKVYYNIDGAGEVEAMCFNADLECNIPLDVSNEPLHHDPDCDGDGGEGTILTNMLSEFTFDIAGTGTSMDIRIEVHMDLGDEEVAMDFFRVRSLTPILPVTLVSFKADKQDDKVMLKWITDSEVNNDYFTIHHSKDGVNFSPIAKVDGNGDSFERLQYQFMHETPVQGRNYYKLQQHDFDGAFVYSDVATIDFDRYKRDLSVSPNPFNHRLSLDINQAFNQDTEVNVYNLVGQLVYATTLEADAVNKDLDLSELATGAYILKVGNAENALTQRIVKY